MREHNPKLYEYINENPEKIFELYDIIKEHDTLGATAAASEALASGEIADTAAAAGASATAAAA